MEELKKLPQVKPDGNGENGLIEAEILAIVLYTGYA
jgi:DNA repair protein RadC